MAPREATGAFPDQFLTFDYDASAVIGVPPPHDPLPAVAATDIANNDGANTSPGALNVESSTSQSAPSQANTHVDPLSIDPTLHLPLSWSNHATEGPSGIPVSMTNLPQPQPQQRSVSLETVTTVTSHPEDESSMPLHPYDGATSPPLSTGSADLNTSVAASPTSSPLRFTGSPIPIGTSLTSLSRRPRPRPFQGTLGSVLDNNTSLESDDEEEEEETPDLEETFDTAASSLPMDVDDDHDLKPHIVEDGASDSSCSDDNGDSLTSSSGSLRMIGRNEAFDLSSGSVTSSEAPGSPRRPIPSRLSSPTSPTSILLSFGPNTTMSDLKYFAEHGCIIALLQALTTTRLVTLGTRMLAEFAKMPHRRVVVVASNRRILEFVQRTMMQIMEEPDWLGREYAVETVRSLTANGRKRSIPHEHT